MIHRWEFLRWNVKCYLQTCVDVVNAAMVDIKISIYLENEITMETISHL